MDAKPSTPIILDANAILRYILDDIPEQANKVQEALEHGAQTKTEFIAECVYVLSGVYKFKRVEISYALTTFLDETQTENHSIIKAGLNYYANTKLDFPDCMMMSYVLDAGCSCITFDKKLIREIEKRRS